jgi:alkylhydroperoxidase/carboxymuconolactone decarboxylase family protein YurZ
MTEETREQKSRRLIEKHVRDRNMDPKSISEHYGRGDFAIEMDPDYFEVNLATGWGYFKDEPRRLDHITRQIVISVFLAYTTRPGCYHQGKKGVMMGATYEQMLEAYEVGRIVGGGPVLRNGMAALKRMMDEGIKPGMQQGPWTNKWVQLGKTAMPMTPEEDPAPSSESREERLIRIIQKYNPDEGGEINKDLAYGVKLDPSFFETYVPVAWGFFGDKPRYLDPIRREMITLGILAFKGRSGEVYSHMKKALKLGATAEQLLEVFEVACSTGAGLPVLLEGLHALRRIDEEKKPGARNKGKK